MIAGRNFRIGLVAAMGLAAAWCRAEIATNAEVDITRRLALDLAANGDHAGAATEFRRLALMTSDPAVQGGYQWAAANEYRQGRQGEQADKLLDRAESGNAAPDESVRWLRGERELDDGNLLEAVFYYGSLLNGASTPEPMKTWCARRLAAAELRRGAPEQARSALSAAPAPQTDGLRALERYRAGRDKNPKLGGVLGMIPGLGYMYAGEYANGFRSIILNGIFLFGMVDTGRDDEWGAFAAISFFEVTWYSGSIYGGIDASHRYNLQRREECVQTIMGGATATPEYEKLPLVSLRFTF